MKNIYSSRMLFVLFCFVLLASCSNNESEDPREDDASAEEKETDEQADEENEDETSSENKQGDLDVWMSGEVTVEKDKIIVEGESNIMPGASIRSSGNSGDWAVIDYQDSAQIEDDGSFYFEFPGRTEEITVDLSLSTGKQEVADHYGANLEKVTGPQKYITDTREEFDVKASFHIDPHQETPYTFELDIPDWSNIPEDYGDSDVWMDVVEVTSDHNYFYFDMKSNLHEGAYVGGNLESSSSFGEPFSYDYTYVHPDGTFFLRVPYHTVTDGMVMPIEFKPADNWWEDVVDNYGENGENLEGDLVLEDGDSKYVRLEVPVDTPDLRPPEKVDMTVEKEEIKMQVPDDLLFDFDESTLKTEAKSVLDDIIEDLESLEEGTVIHINGHTDNEGEEEYNQQLSEERAEAVLQYMEADQDWDTIEFIMNGFGETQPIDSNEEEEGRERNRRVEIVINPQ